MITYTSSPWKDGRATKLRNKLVALLFLLSMVFGFSMLIGGANAHADNDSDGLGTLIVGSDSLSQSKEQMRRVFPNAEINAESLRTPSKVIDVALEKSKDKNYKKIVIAEDYRLASVDKGVNFAEKFKALKESAPEAEIYIVDDVDSSSAQNLEKVIRDSSDVFEGIIPWGNEASTLKSDYYRNGSLSPTGIVEYSNVIKNALGTHATLSANKRTISSNKIKLTADEDYSNVLIIGDSITNGAKSQIEKKLPGATIKAKDGKQYVTGLSEITDVDKYDTVVMALGTNTAVTSQQIEETKAKIGDARLILMTIYGTNDNDTTHNREVERSGVDYFDWGKAVRDDNSLVGGDNVHPNSEKGFEKFAQLMADAVNDKSNDSGDKGGDKDNAGGDNDNAGGNNGGDTSGSGSGPQAAEGDNIIGNKTNVAGSGSSKDPLDSGQDGTNAISPLAYANNLSKIGEFNGAMQYLTAFRWESFVVPQRPLDVLDTSSVSDSIIAPGIDTALSIGGVAMKGAMIFFSAGVGQNLSSFGVSTSDRIYGNTFAGRFLSYDGQQSRTIEFTTTVLLITAIMAFLQVIKKGAGTLEQRVKQFAFSIIKVVIMFSFMAFVGLQSRNNHSGDGDAANESSYNKVIDGVLGKGEKEEGQSDFNEQVQNARENGVNGSQGIWESGKSKLQEGAGRCSANNNVSMPCSWEPLSLGWMVSVVYWIAHTLANLIVKLVIMLILFPVEGLDNALQNKREANSTGMSTNDNATMCDRYTGALHMAFSDTAISQAQGIFSDLLVKMDDLYISNIIEHYEYMYGGSNRSAGNSYCWSLELENGIPAGDWLMVSRAAGLYTEVAGSGNLIGGGTSIASGKRGGVTSGSNLMAGPGSSAGYLVAADGRWISGEEIEGYPLRAELFMGRIANSDGLTQAKYYFAACEWNSNTNWTGMPNADWTKVLAMGDTGNWAKNEDNEGSKGGLPDIDGIDMTIDKGSVEGKFNEAFGMSGSSKEEFNAKKQFIGPIDCMNPELFPIGKEKDSSKVGWGSESVWAKRWGFAPKNPNLAAQIAEAAKETITSNPSVQGGLEAIGTLKSLANGVTDTLSGKSDENKAKEEAKNSKEEFDASTRFVTSSDEKTGRNYAQEFWYASNGVGITKQGILAGLLAALMICMAIYFGISVLPLIVVNFFFSVVMIVAGFFVVGSFIMFVVRGGRFK